MTSQSGDSFPVIETVDLMSWIMVLGPEKGYVVGSDFGHCAKIWDSLHNTSISQVNWESVQEEEMDLEIKAAYKNFKQEN